MSVLELSMLGSLMILAIIVMRALALYRLPRQTFVVGWLLSAARLLVPIAIPSVLSIYALFRTEPGAVSVPAPPAVHGEAISELPAAEGTALELASHTAEHTLDIWSVVWITGAVITAAAFAFLYVRWLRRFAQSLPVDNEETAAWLKAHSIRRRVQVRRSSWIAAPLTYGLIRPVILLPSSFSPNGYSDLDCILSHEMTHIRRFDSLTKFVIIAAVCVHWFNPLAWIMFVLANRDIELACDEAVVRNARDQAEYARMLIRMEEQRGTLMPFCSSCSRNVLEERILSIMRIKKYTWPVLILAIVSILCIGTTLATSPPTQNTAETTDLVMQDLIARTEPDGTTSYSFDGGRTFSPMTDTELEEQYGLQDVEFWTAEEYEEWLENEKTALQKILGTTAWTNTDGEFIWTQEKIDETIAAYERTLGHIKNGLLVSKTVDGSGDAVLVESIADSHPETPSIEDYAQFGLAGDSSGILYYNGERVGYFEDRVEVEPGMSASKYSCYDPKGTVHVRTVRQATLNSDGSTDPFGILTGLETISETEAEHLIRDYLVTGVPQAIMAEDETVEQMSAEDAAEARASIGQVLAPYEQFGLTGQIDDTGSLKMHWNGRAVHCLFDELTGTWIANNMYGTDLLDSSAVHLETIYKDGKLTGLRECQPPEPQIVEASVMQGMDSLDTVPGITFEEMFDLYAPLGITYDTVRANGSVRYNLFYNGQPINHFVDISGARTFTFDSADQVPNGVTASVVYENGKTAGIKID